MASEYDDALGCFAYCESLASIVIPDSITVIGDESFNGCKSLTSVDFGNVEKIKDMAFLNCTKLEEIIIPDTVKEIGAGVFYGCSGLKKAKVSSSIKELKTFKNSYGFFGKCSSLVEIDISGITALDVGTFADCSSLVMIKINNIEILRNRWTTPSNKDITCGNYKLSAEGVLTVVDKSAVPDEVDIPTTIGDRNVSFIGGSAFSECTNLKSVKMNNTSVSSINMGAFSGCSALQEVVFTTSISRIEESAFSNCTSLKSISIPRNVESIGVSAFKGCAALELIALNGKLTTIGDEAFSGCSSLKSFMVPGDVYTIGSKIFDSCSSLESIEIQGNVNTLNGCAFEGCGSLKSIYIDSVSDTSTSPWGATGATVLHASDFSCLNGALKYNKCEKTINVVLIPGKVGKVKVTSIADEAFKDVTSLNKVIISSSDITAIGKCAFSNCTGLTSISLPRSLSSIGEYAFNGCKSLKTINLSDSLTVLPKGVFSGAGLTLIDITSNITKIEAAAFKNCTDLTSITIPGNVNEIALDAFSGCNGLKTIKVNKNSGSIEGSESKWGAPSSATITWDN